MKAIVLEGYVGIPLALRQSEYILDCSSGKPFLEKPNTE